MSGNRILITTDYLKPGDEVDQFLRDQGYEPIYRPMGGATAQELIEALQDVTGALIAKAAGSKGARELLASLNGNPEHPVNLS